MQEANFNLIAVYAIVQKQFKQITAFVIVCLIATTVVLFFLPKYYKSTAIVVAANPALADKARLFNNNIQGLYSSFGSGDDLDRIDGIANLDTTFKQLVTTFQLTNYYKIKDTNAALRTTKAVLRLREDIDFEKTELGQFKCIVSTKNKQLSANIANRLIVIVQKALEGIWQKNYQTSLEKIAAATIELENEVTAINKQLQILALTSSDAIMYTNKRTAILQQLQQYYTVANEFKLAIQNKVAGLYIIEQAVPAAKHHKPKKLNVLIATLFISFCFACTVVIIQQKQ